MHASAPVCLALSFLPSVASVTMREFINASKGGESPRLSHNRLVPASTKVS